MFVSIGGRARQPKLCNLLLVILIAERNTKNSDGEIVEQHPLVQNYTSATEKTYCNLKTMTAEKRLLKSTTSYQMRSYHNI